MIFFLDIFGLNIYFEISYFSLVLILFTLNKLWFHKKRNKILKDIPYRFLYQKETGRLWFQFFIYNHKILQKAFFGLELFKDRIGLFQVAMSYSAGRDRMDVKHMMTFKMQNSMWSYLLNFTRAIWTQVF